jgi:UDP-N-acetylglucosamine--N-acetylmuramyl-(pentapeptide) pyrophosphoryl-undecaprenol N-acetylglucosamine transferase
MKIVLTGGGTAGHIIPNLALVPELKKYFDAIHYIGGDGMEKDLVKAAGLPFHSTEVIKLDRSHLLKNAKIPFVMIKAIRSATAILDTIKPDLVFSKGGYAALPTCFAARRLNIPVVLHESDMTLGLANKLTARFAKLTLTSFEETEGGEYIGNPVRNEIFEGKKARAVKNYLLPENRPILLVVGGSSGSAAINDAVYAALPKLTKDFFVIHIAGKNGNKDIKFSQYLQLEYAFDINDLFAAADVVVSRGGANSLSELAALGKTTLVIPLPKGGSRGDQVDNALSYHKKGLVTMLEQSLLTPDTLAENIKKLYLSRRVSVKKMAADTNVRIVKRLLEVIAQNNKQ